MSDAGVSAQRVRLGQTLRRLRLAAGFSGQEMARRAGWSQSKVSRLELGQSVFRPTEMDAWLEITGAKPADRTAVLEQAEALSTEVVQWRRAERLGLPWLQMDAARIEASSKLIQTYNPQLVPGLLQTAEYTRRLLQLIYGKDQPDIPAAVAARQARQEILFDSSRHLEFLIADVALRWHLGAGAMRAQIDRIRSLATLDHLPVGIVVTSGVMPIWASHGFTIFDERDDEPAIVDIEVLHSWLTVSDEVDVARYRAAFAALRAAALFGEEALDELASIASDLRD